MVGLRCARLHRHRERQLEAAATTEDELTGIGISEDVADPERAARRDQLPPWSGVALGARRERGLDPLTAARECRIGRHELVEPHLGVSQRETQPVVG